MEYHFTKEEMDIFMDLTFLLGSVLNLHILGERFLEQIGRLISYEKAFVLLYSNEEQAFYPCAEVRFSRELLLEYLQRYLKLDYLIAALKQSKGIVTSESDGFGELAHENMELYHNFLKPNHLKYRLCFNAFSQNGELLGIVMFFRSSIFPDFGTKEKQISKNIQMYFSQALENSLKFEQLTINETVNDQVYDSLEHIILIIDSNFHIKYKNQSATNYLQQQGKDESYASLPASIRTPCETLIQKVKWRGDEQLLIATEEGHLALRMVKAQNRLFSGKRDLLLVLKQETSKSEPTSEPITLEKTWLTDRFLQTLRKTYGLTEREAEIISYALNGYSNEKIKATMFISMSTVKSHFQHAYAKISVSNRKELLLLFAEYSISPDYRKQFEQGFDTH